MDYLVAQHRLSKVKACRAVRLSRSAYYADAAGSSEHDQPVTEVLNQLMENHPRWGFGLCFDWMRLQGYPWNHKRVHRIYKAMGLNLPRRRKRRLPERPRQALVVPDAVNLTWSLDFMSDALYGGRRFRTLNILDDAAREILNIVIDTSIPSGRVVTGAAVCVARHTKGSEARQRPRTDFSNAG